MEDKIILLKSVYANSSWYQQSIFEESLLSPGLGEEVIFLKGKVILYF